jgi:hypothetical protein
MRAYQIEPRTAELGGGWSLKLYENQTEMGGGIFPQKIAEDDFDESYQDAIDEGEQWVG